jgi:hypothetical protein
MIKMIDADGARALCKDSLPKPYEQWQKQCDKEIRQATKLNEYAAIVNLDLSFNPMDLKTRRNALVTWLRDLGFKAVTWDGDTDTDNFAVVIRWQSAD